VPLTFKINFLLRIPRHDASFLLLRADQEIQLYAQPVNFDPRKPAAAITKPDGFLEASLADRVGSTARWLGRAHLAAHEGASTKATFLYDCERAFQDREKLIFDQLKRDDWDLFVAVIETPTASRT